jgi:hypothetical protein
MRILTSFVTTAALLMTAGLIGCGVDTDPFDTLTSTLGTSLSQGDGDGDDTTGDGDGDTTTGDGDGDTTPGDGDGDGDGEPGDGDGECTAGTFGCPCGPGDMCDEGLSCEDGTCGLGGGDGDGDGDPGMCTSWDPAMCDPPGVPIGVDGIEGGFCTCMCTTDADCLAGPPGTQAGCVLATPDMMTFCGLICSVANDACPVGATCKTAGQMDPDVGLCTYP